ncbi:MAG: amidohydrolase family protein [Lachnospiraceae bacterium]|nr:amidohydrolase family protein [Lachnospiraceae bacterium]MBQ1415137.1 amidohydrolase family protein [Lachnospiraceae bacterium]MBQ9464367.1 amidohydrolase family protein [Lachnospiraceae bacterium]
MKTAFAECHGHMMMDGADYTAARHCHEHGVNMAVVRAEFDALRNAGVTYFRDGGDALGVSARAAGIAPEYGIEYRTPIFAIHKKGHYGGIVGRGFADLSEYRALVKEAGKAGCDFIKVMVSGIVTFRRFGELSCPSLPADEIREMIRIAHDDGFAIMIHVNGADAVRACVEAGADSIEHGNFLDSETLEALAASRTVWVPTVAAIAAFHGRDGFDPAVTGAILKAHLEEVRKAAELGARIASGSDSGAVGVPHGAGIVRECELLAEAGLTRTQTEEGNRLIREIFKRN